MRRSAGNSSALPAINAPPTTASRHVATGAASVAVESTLVRTCVLDPLSCARAREGQIVTPTLSPSRRKKSRDRLAIICEIPSEVTPNLTGVGVDRRPCVYQRDPIGHARNRHVVRDDGGRRTELTVDRIDGGQHELAGLVIQSTRGLIAQ